MKQHILGGRPLTYHIPAELSHYIHRGFLSNSNHPVRLVQDFLVQALEREWPVSMVTEHLPLLIHSSPQRLNACCPEIQDTHTHCYWLHPSHTHTTSHTPSDDHKHIDTLLADTHITYDSDDHKHIDTLLADTHITYDSEDEGRERECSSHFKECVGEGEECVGEGEECVGVGGYVLRPSLLPQVEILREEREHREREEVLHGVSGLVFQRVHISPWSPPAFHELLLWGAWPKASQSIPDLGRSLERLLTPYGLSLAEEQGSLWLAAEPMGRLGRLWADDLTDGVSVCLNLDLLASLVYSLPDWRLLWSPDPRFLNHFLLRPLPEQPFHPFSLFPQSFVYDISFWAGPDWQEAAFHALVREASREMVENVTLIDTYTPNTQTDTHPDVTHTYTTNTLTDTHPDVTHTYTQTDTHPDVTHTYTPNTQTDTHPDVTHTYTPNTQTDTHADVTHTYTQTDTHPDVTHTCTPYTQTDTHPDVPHTYTPYTQTDTHPDVTHTSYCYRLTYRSHTHALSHTRAQTPHTPAKPAVHTHASHRQVVSVCL
uniref:Ferredoxin-fold anticodon binding domain containing 1 n=1 Tax=Oncorhynchus tshawytscha TaxID=74940 RepID=A0AAZ3SJ49_ONCTS